MKSSKKYIFDVALLVLIFLMTYRLMFNNQDVSEIAANILSASKKWVFAGAVLAVVYVCCEGFVIRYMLHILKQSSTVISCLKYAFIGFFFSYITPSASGGQPAQMYYMSKDGIDPGYSALIMLLITIAYKSILVMICAVFFIFKYALIKLHTSRIYGLMILGVFLNTAFIALLVLMLKRPEFMRKTGLNLADFLNKKKLIKPEKYGKLTEKINAVCGKYSSGAEYIKKNPKPVFNVFLITTAERIFLLAVTWTIYRSFGLSGSSFLDIIAVQSMIGIAVEMLPLPGAAGITESCFLRVFKNIFTDGLVRPALLASRGLSFYLILFIGAAVTLAAHINVLRKEKSES